MIAPIIAENKEQIISACKKYRVKNLYVFGSAARGTDFGAYSDIDFLYAFDRDKIEFDEYADNYFQFRFGLEDILKRKIDLVPEETVTNPFLLRKINQDKIKLYG